MTQRSPRHLVVLSAGLSTPSSTRLLADRLGEAARAAVTARGEGVDVTTIEIAHLATDLAQAMTTGGLPTPALAAAQEQLAGADGVIAVTPVFTASYSGLFKTFVDTLEPGTLDGVPVLIAATAGSPRHSLVLDHALRPLFAYLRAVVVPTGVFAATEDHGGGDGGADLQQRVTRAAGELAALVTAGAPDAARDALDGAWSEQGGPVHLMAPVPTGPAPRRRTSTRVGPVTDFADLLRGHDGG